MTIMATVESGAPGRHISRTTHTMTDDRSRDAQLPWDEDDFEAPAPVIKVGTFASPDFAERHPDKFAEYVSLRVRGHQSYRSFVITFGAAYDKNQHTPARLERVLEYGVRLQRACAPSRPPTFGT